MKNASELSITMQQQNNLVITITTTLSETTIKQNHQDKFHSTIFLHCLKRQIHEDHGDLRLIVDHQNNPNLEFELVHKRPRNILLKDPMKQSKYIPSFPV